MGTLGIIIIKPERETLPAMEIRMSVSFSASVNASLHILVPFMPKTLQEPHTRPNPA